MEKNRRRSKYINLLVFIAALLVVWLWNRNSPQRDVIVELGETAITVTAPGDFAETIPYDSIRALELYGRELDLGTQVEGETTRRAWYGRWRNELWGEYTLAVDPGIRTFLFIETGDGKVLLFNFESGDMTESLYDALSEWTVSGG